MGRLGEWVAKQPIESFDDVAVYRDHIRRGKEEHPLTDLTAKVETTGDLERRITATRMLMTGPFALALRKKKDHRTLYLTIEGPDFAWLLELKPKQESDARRFAVKLLDAARKAKAEPAS